MARRAKTTRFEPDLTRVTTDVEPELVLQILDVKKSQKSKPNEDGLEGDIRLMNKLIKSSKRLLKQRKQGLKDRVKAQKQAAKDEDKA